MPKEKEEEKDKNKEKMKSCLIFLFTSKNSDIYKSFETKITRINEGNISDSVARTEPNIPAELNPAYVATFIPTGPGVTDATAII